MGSHRKNDKTRVKSKTRSTRVGLHFPVRRVHRHLRNSKHANAPVYLVAVLQ
ncbi:uncharacterized protein DEA37_0006670 [Paragonimus westermani]|uniref:Histone H2A n=1 Tax=Paragonimus westermani TaxID=34504 RepID=A0A5J4NW76_9TREM|nr:uncharacterized protein DEA37_0006670 [Paragonimus westermani]